MSSFDFNSLNRPLSRSRPVDPVELFRSIPALSQSPNDLWQGQSKALEQWNSKRQMRDVLISLHTGAGKSIVGLLIAQSLVNEGVAKVVYACATNDLVSQTAREIETKLGFLHTTRVAGSFSNELYSTGQSFCITNYNALFNSKSIFRGDLRPGAIIFDDAHVAEKIIRDSYTIRINKDDLPDVYGRILTLLEPHFSAIDRGDYFRRLISGDSSYRYGAAPPGAVVSLARNGALLTLLRNAEASIPSLAFPLGHLADHLNKCSLIFSKDGIEICPAFLPSKRIPLLVDSEIRRVYLSATLTSEVDFCRAFGRRPSHRIEPESDAGMGERLIILGDRENLTYQGSKGVTDLHIATVLSKEHKLLISTPSYPAASKYKQLALPPSTNDFSAKLDDFRKAIGPATFVLVGRVDGIDLPHSTCRVMLADGLPLGFSLLENYLYDTLEMRNSYAAKLANRITQMFGRTNRGRNDFSVIFISEKRLVNWLSTPRNISLLPELLRKQLLLGKSLVTQFNVRELTVVPSLVSQVVNRDAGWLQYYQDSISGRDIDVDQRDQAAENDALLTDAALAEAEFAGLMWDGNAAAARVALGTVVDKVVTADRRLAGWFNIQIGHALELEGDTEAAAKQYSQGRSRIATILALPFPTSQVSLASTIQSKNLLHKKLLEIFVNDVRQQNDHLAKYERSISPLFDPDETASRHEEAMRSLGELFGFAATRPEQDDDSGSTLDVMWENPDTREAILIELKTKKLAGSLINIDDVGQAFNHVEWAATNTSSKKLGIILVSLASKRSLECAPSSDMWISTLAPFRRLYEEFFQNLWAIQAMPNNQKYPEISAVSERAEWQPTSIFARLKGVQLSSIPTS